MSEVNVNRSIKLDNVRLLRVSLTKPYVGKDAKVDPATGKQDGKFHVDEVEGACAAEPRYDQGQQPALLLAAR